MIINSFNEINDMISVCDFYLFPMDIQRLLPMILMNTQRPVVFRGFGNMELSRRTFNRVSHFMFQFETAPIFCMVCQSMANLICIFEQMK